MLGMYAIILLPPPLSSLGGKPTYIVSFGNNWAPRATQQKQTCEVVRFCPCKWHDTNACDGLKYIHPDRNLLFKWKKPHQFQSQQRRLLRGRAIARVAHFSGLVLDSELYVGYNLVLACCVSRIYQFSWFFGIFSRFMYEGVSFFVWQVAKTLWSIIVK